MKKFFEYIITVMLLSTITVLTVYEILMYMAR